jgi:hypothetical protein
MGHNLGGMNMAISPTNIQKKIAINAYNLSWVGSAMLLTNIEGERIRGNKNQRRR